MMNKGRKRLLEVMAIEGIYSITIDKIDNLKTDIEWKKENIEEMLKDDPEADTSYYEECIEESEIQIKASEKVAETLLKLM